MSVRSKSVVVTAVAIITALAISACGSSNDDSSADSTSSAVGALKGSKAKSAAEAGEAMAKEEGPPTTLTKDVTVGVVEVLGASEGVQRNVAGAEEASRALGWKTVACDGQGVPSKIADCFQFVESQGANVILSIANDPALINRPLREAKDKDIPVYNIGGDVPNTPLFAGSYAPSDATLAEVIDEYLFKEMEAEDRTTLAVQTTKAVGGLVVRTEQLKSDLGSHPDIEIIAENETDFADPVNSTTEATKTVLTANPDVGAFWSANDTDVPSIASAVQSSQSGSTPPLIVGFYGNKPTLDLIREGVVTAVSEAPTEATPWIALDQQARLLAREETPVQSEFAVGMYPLEFLEPFIVSKEENLPPKGSFAEPQHDFVSFFKAKWAAEYSKP